MAYRKTDDTAARLKWAALPGKDVAFAIDHLGDGSRAISTMCFIAKHRYESDAFDVLDALYYSAGLKHKPDDGVQDWRVWVDRHSPGHLDVFDKYARLAASHMKIDDDWIAMEAEAPREEAL